MRRRPAGRYRAQKWETECRRSGPGQCRFVSAKQRANADGEQRNSTQQCRPAGFVGRSPPAFGRRGNMRQRSIGRGAGNAGCRWNRTRGRACPLRGCGGWPGALARLGIAWVCRLFAGKRSSAANTKSGVFGALFKAAGRTFFHKNLWLALEQGQAEAMRRYGGSYQAQSMRPARETKYFGQRRIEKYAS